MEKGRLALFLFLLSGPLLIGCPDEQPNDVFNALDVDVATVDFWGNPESIFITDMGNDLSCTPIQDSRILRVHLGGFVLWSFDDGETALDGAHNADLNDTGDQMIISDSCNDRVLIISYPAGEILWDSNRDCPDLDLHGTFPNDANFLENGHLLITLLYTHLVIELDRSLCDNGVPGDEIVWSFGEAWAYRYENDFDHETLMCFPHNADRLSNGNTIIADSGVPELGRGRIIEVNPAGEIVWTYKNYYDDPSRHDCTIKGVPNKECEGVHWPRDADVFCVDEACETGAVTVMGVHQTVAVLRDLSTLPLPGEPHPRGRQVIYQVEHDAGNTYDTDFVPMWRGSTNWGRGFYLVSNHGFLGLDLGNWVRVVAVDAGSSTDNKVWEMTRIKY